MCMCVCVCVCVCTCMTLWFMNEGRGVHDKVLIKGKVPFLALCQVSTSKVHTIVHLLGF